MLAALAYYDLIDLFTVTDRAVVTSYLTVLRPVGSKFYAIVMTLVVLHLVLVLSIFVTYMAKSRYTLLSNVWHVMAQFQGLEANTWVRKYRFMWDRDVRKDMVRTDNAAAQEMVGSDVGGVLVGLAVSETDDGGQVQLKVRKRRATNS